MNETGEDLPSTEVLPENVIGRTITAVRKVQLRQAELVRTPYGRLTGSWTGTDGWEPPEEFMLVLAGLLDRFTEHSGPDVMNLKWERTA